MILTTLVSGMLMNDLVQLPITTRGWDLLIPTSTQRAKNSKTDLAQSADNETLLHAKFMRYAS